jgi:hypothetical protein
MFFGASKDPISSMFCDFSSSFWPKEDFFNTLGYKWPDDFEKGEQIGDSRFQVINDFKSGLSFYNHQGILYPDTKKKILERRSKVKKDIIVERFGNRNPFREDDVYLLETGLNDGNVEYIIFNYNKENCNSFSSFRKIIYRFPLFWLIWEVLALKKQRYKKGFSFERIEKLEHEKIINHKKLNEWSFVERIVCPCADVYTERVELPLTDYNFISRDEQVSIWLKIEFFEADW